MDPFSLAIAILTGVAGSAGWAGCVQAYQYRNHRAPLRTFYRFDQNFPIFVVQSALTHNEGDEFFVHTTAIDGVFSYQMIFEYLMDIKFNRNYINLKFAPEVSQADLDDNLILIGGYENNQVSFGVNGKGGRLFYFENNTILEKGKPLTKWAAVLNGGGRIVRDYCLVTRMPNPYRAANSQTAIISFEGVRHFGTLGGVRFMNANNLRKQTELFGCRLQDAQLLEIVISCDVSVLQNGGFLPSNERVEAIAVNGKRTK